MMVKGRSGLRMECWNRCGPAVLRYQTHWLIFWTLILRIHSGYELYNSTDYKISGVT